MKFRKAAASVSTRVVFKELAQEIQKEKMIAAVIGSVPRTPSGVLDLIGLVGRGDMGTRGRGTL